MPWIQRDNHVCTLPDLRVYAPELGRPPHPGDCWACDCGATFTVHRVDYGHDVQVGESDTGYRWKRQ